MRKKSFAVKERNTPLEKLRPLRRMATRQVYFGSHTLHGSFISIIITPL
jgi:hypothetical protein